MINNNYKKKSSEYFINRIDNNRIETHTKENEHFFISKVTYTHPHAHTQNYALFRQSIKIKMQTYTGIISRKKKKNYPPISTKNYIRPFFFIRISPHLKLNIDLQSPFQMKITKLRYLGLLSLKKVTTSFNKTNYRFQALWLTGYKFPRINLV